MPLKRTALKGFPEATEDQLEDLGRCIENYTGAHCEEVFPPSSSIQTKSDLFAAFVTLTVLLGTLIIGTPYFLLKKGHLQRAISVQDDIDLAETSSTGAHHSFQDIGRQKTKDHDL
ncbi:pro-neuregulin-4, membrane-bound isoform [Canis lupus familiaris]|uniref:pro-neuregulin-4, membrane-bound isoform n=1 Tax=Canis lupus familiaris TaxID=9615 RepID=UPI0018F4110B|nr:pro-neuregulin-4, membrane-bound isoform [Canis lupus familiaris]XP_038435776.1 pro-neuregulin-4, membrane-bound isoform [Canis lupus familiaris]